jgi:hypothetical protein
MVEWEMDREIWGKNGRGARGKIIELLEKLYRFPEKQK